jgi:hypothetical protein
MITSLTRGLPSREICCHGPEALVVPFALRTRTFWRLAAAQTPRTASGSFGPVGRAWSLVSCWIGIWIAIVSTLKPPTPSMPAAAGSGIAWSELSGRSPARSKIEPRSTKNGSSRCPANTFVPSPSDLTAVAASDA